MRKLQPSFRNVKERDDVYWIEIERYTEDNKPIYETRKGYYLATYIMGEENCHIVTLGNITSCVVRHKKIEELFSNYEDAQKECDIKNQSTHQHEDKGE